MSSNLTIQEYINLYFTKYPNKKNLILQGHLNGGLLNNLPIQNNATELNNFDSNPVLSQLLTFIPVYFIISKYNSSQVNNFYNTQVIESKGSSKNNLELGFGLALSNNFKFYITQTKQLFGNIYLDNTTGEFVLNRYNNINNIFDTGNFNVISYQQFYKETGIDPNKP